VMVDVDVNSLMQVISATRREGDDLVLPRAVFPLRGLRVTAPVQDASKPLGLTTNMVMQFHEVVRGEYERQESERDAKASSSNTSRRVDEREPASTRGPEWTAPAETVDLPPIEAILQTRLEAVSAQLEAVEASIGRLQVTADSLRNEKAAATRALRALGGGDGRSDTRPPEDGGQVGEEDAGGKAGKGRRSSRVVGKRVRAAGAEGEGDGAGGGAGEGGTESPDPAEGVLNVP
jgi:hypothetical protein